MVASNTPSPAPQPPDSPEKTSPPASEIKSIESPLMAAKQKIESTGARLASAREKAKLSEGIIKTWALDSTSTPPIPTIETHAGQDNVDKGRGSKSAVAGSGAEGARQWQAQGQIMRGGDVNVRGGDVTVKVELPSQPAAVETSEKKTESPEVRDQRLLAEAAKKYMIAINLYAQSPARMRDDPQSFQYKQIRELDQFMKEGGSDWRFQMGPKGTPTLLPYRKLNPIQAANMPKLEKAVGAAYALFNLLMKGFDKKADAAIRRAQRKGDYTVTKETERQKVVAEMNQVLEKQNVTDVHFAFNANFPRPFLMPGAVPAWTDGNPQVASN